MTEETQQSETAAQNEAQTSSPDVGKVKDNKKEKCRPMTKVYSSKVTSILYIPLIVCTEILIVHVLNDAFNETMYDDLRSILKTLIT